MIAVRCAAICGLNLESRISNLEVIRCWFSRGRKLLQWQILILRTVAGKEADGLSINRNQRRAGCYSV